MREGRTHRQGLDEGAGQRVLCGPLGEVEALAVRAVPGRGQVLEGGRMAAVVVRGAAYGLGPQPLERGSAADWDVTAEILEQIAHALAAAHDVDVVHRDLKPDNVFLATARTAGASFMVKILDFGLAKVVSASPQNTAAIGSPLWMAPEQMQVDALLSPATDVWAYGLIAFRLFTGRFYWQRIDGSVAVWMKEAVLDPMPPASERAKEQGASLPPGFDAWFAKAVARDPGERFQHGRDAWQSLSDLLFGPESSRTSRRSLIPAAPPGMSRGLSTRREGLGSSPASLASETLSASQAAGSVAPSADLQGTHRGLSTTEHVPQAAARRRGRLWAIASMATVLAAGTVVALTNRASTSAESTTSGDTSDNGSTTGAIAPAASAPAASLSKESTNGQPRVSMADAGSDPARQGTRAASLSPKAAPRAASKRLPKVIAEPERAPSPASPAPRAAPDPNALPDLL
jgi:serine/threonine protein kinase